MAGKQIGWREAGAWLAEIVGPDMPYVRLAMVYGVAISLLSLATPISVQLLINSVVTPRCPRRCGRCRACCWGCCCWWPA